MKKLLVGLSLMFLCTIAVAHTMKWYVDDQIISTTTCDSGDNITPPTAPSKRGYHLKEWTPRYILLEYLESTGTQWIKFGTFYADAKYDILIDSDGSAFGINNALWIKCGGVHWRATLIGDTSIACNIRQTLNLHYTVNLTDNTKTFVLSNKSFTLSGSSDLNTEMNGLSFGLFGINYTSNINNYYLTSGKIYSVSVFKNDVLIHQVIPVLDPDGTPCMYDKVTKQFFYNQGTGQFIAGPEVGAL